MITDKFLRVSDAQAVTTTAVSTDKIDLSVAREIGEGDDLFMVFSVGTAFARGTSINFQVTVADDAALSTNATTIGMSGVILTAALTASSQQVVRLNPQIASLGRRYLGATYTVVGTMSAGTVTADIVTDIQDGKKFYANGFAVL
jgi:hypothetical protein